MQIFNLFARSPAPAQTDAPPAGGDSGGGGGNPTGLGGNPNAPPLSGQNMPPRAAGPNLRNQGKPTVIQRISRDEYTEVARPSFSYTTTSASSRKNEETPKNDEGNTPPAQSRTQAQRNVPEYNYTTTSKMNEEPVVELGNRAPRSSEANPSPNPHIVSTQPVITMPPMAHLSNTTSFVPGMDLGNPTGALANAAFQAGSEGAGIAASGMEVGMGQLGQVMTLGMKQQTEMATMKLFTDMANAVAKEVRNVSKGVKDQAGN
jgi:hypothetical protein